MVLGSIRLGLLLATLGASLQVAAETRYWTLTGVQLEDGAVATGYFSYDDATGTVANWNLRLNGDGGPFIAWTLLPGNSHAWFPQPLYLYSGSPGLVSGFWWRSLIITPLVPLDGRSATVSIDVSSSHDFFEDDFGDVGISRKIIAGSLVLTPMTPPVTIVNVDEFYHPGLRHYFITADAAEKQLLDTGVYPGWERTGESFKAYATGSSADGLINPVCRYYGDAEQGLNSHFFSADLYECVTMVVTFSVAWLFESDNVFQINLPDRVTGACPVGTIPVYRLWNQRADSNHRYTTSAAIRAQMLAAGHLAEGYGTDGVVMCAVQ
jgi:hypothetical protein